MVGRQGRHDGVWSERLFQNRRHQADRRRGVAAFRLTDNVPGGDIGKLGADTTGVAGIGDDIQPLRRNQSFDPVGGLLKHGPLADNVQKLLRGFLPAARPETCPPAPGRDNNGDDGRGG